MAPLRYAAKLDPFLSLDCAPTPSLLAQSKERKGSNFAIWQHCHQALRRDYQKLIAVTKELTAGLESVTRECSGTTNMNPMT